MTDTPTDPEPTDEQLRSDEARRYRQRLRESEDTNARLVQDAAEREQRLQAVERQMVTNQISAKVNDPEYFWDKTPLDTLRGEDGLVDLEKAEAAAEELTQAHPSLRAAAPGTPAAAMAGGVTGSGKIGYPPTSVLDADNAEPAEQARDWAMFLTQAARGELPAQQ